MSRSETLAPIFLASRCVRLAACPVAFAVGVCAAVRAHLAGRIATPRTDGLGEGGK